MSNKRYMVDIIIQTYHWDNEKKQWEKKTKLKLLSKRSAAEALVEMTTKMDEITQRISEQKA